MYIIHTYIYILSIGVSCKTQEIYLTVFILRYIDLLWEFKNVYLTSMKILFIGSTAYMIYLMRFKRPTCTTYDINIDKFEWWKWLLCPCIVLSLIFNYEFLPAEILWSLSIFLESVAIIPQLMMLRDQSDIENLTADYVFALGAYRGFYILSWIYTAYFTDTLTDYISIMGGIIQVLLYADFFYYYAQSKWYGKRLILPVSEIK